MLPTLATAGWAISRGRPAFTDGLLERTGHALGAVVACERLATPRPGSFELRGVALLSTNRSTEFLRCDRVELACVEGDWRFRLGVLEVVDPHETGRWLKRVLATDLVAQGRCDRVTAAGDDSKLLADALIQLQFGDAERRSLSLHEADGAGRLLLTADGAGYAFETKTGAAGVDAAWAPGQPFRGVAERIRFDGGISGRGHLHDNQVEATAEGELQINGVSVGGLTAARGVLTLDEFAWNEERIDRLHGRLDLRGGSLTHDLVLGMNQALEADASKAMIGLYSEQRDQYAFTQLSCELEFDERGLTLVGRCDEIDGRQRGGLIAHAIVEHEGEPLLLEPRARPLPAAALLQAWSPRAALELPATRNALEAAQRLPAPLRRDP